MAAQLAGKAAVVQVNTQENPGLATRFSVRGIPLTLLLQGGRVVAQLPGAQTVAHLVAWFRQHS